MSKPNKTRRLVDIYTIDGKRQVILIPGEHFYDPVTMVPVLFHTTAAPLLQDDFEKHPEILEISYKGALIDFYRGLVDRFEPFGRSFGQNVQFDDIQKQ